MRRRDKRCFRRAISTSFFRLDPDNLLNAWNACDDAGLDIWLSDEPLARPRDRWLAERRSFSIESVVVPVARLQHIVDSKQAAGRDKDQLFLATHKDALEQLLKKPELE